MTHAKPFLLACGFFSLGHAPLQAADSEGRFAIRGIGGESCSAVTAAIDAADEAGRIEIIGALSTWLGGYLTFANRMIDGRFDATPLASDIDMLAVVVDRCEKEPDLQFEAAAFDILGVLVPYGVETLSQLVELEDAIALRKATLEALRESMLLGGYIEQGTDEEFLAAIARFNADQGIEGAEGIVIETILRSLAME
jgi:hypothetical protein